MKTKQEIRTEMLAILSNKAGINTTEEGSIAIAIVDALLEEIYALYQEIDLMKSQAYLSTSTGLYVDLIGDLLNVSRLENEADSDYKIRIANAVPGGVKGNRIAIEQAIWNTPGVASFDYRQYGQGTGSFTVFIYPQVGVNQERLLANVRLSLADVVSEGIKYEVRMPNESRVDLALAVQFKEGLTLIQKQDIRNRIRDTITTYINSLQKGAVLYINEVTQRSMSINDDILDVSYISLSIDGVQKSISNTFPDNDTRFSSGTITIL